MKRLPGFRFDAKAQLAHFEVVLPGVGVSKHGKRKFARRRCTVAAKDVIEATAKYHAFRREVLEAKPPPPPRSRSRKSPHNPARERGARPPLGVGDGS